jgi:single-strand DNA-binding protein
MASVNRVFLLGNCTRDPELRTTPGGTSVTDLGLAVNRTWTDNEGMKKEETTFVDVTLWGRQAEVAGEYLHKGNPVFIEGRIQMDSWVDKQTAEKRSRLKIVAENLQLLGDRRESALPPRPPQRTREPQPQAMREPDPDDAVPF